MCGEMFTVRRKTANKILRRKGDKTKRTLCNKGTVVCTVQRIKIFESKK
jgi:hypothetical protein